MKRQHKIFADGMRAGLDPTAAYMAAYPKAKSNSARIKSYGLLKNVTIARYIKDKEDEIEGLAKSIAVEKRSDVILSEVLTADRKKDLLRQIAEGTLMTKTFIPTGEKENGKMGVKLVGMSEPSVADRMKAISIHNIMVGDNATIKTAATNVKGEDVIPTRQVMIINGKEVEF